MQVAGIRRLGAQVEMIEVGEPRPLAGDEVLLEVRAAGVANWDEFVRTGGWDVGARPPMALGVAAAGTVLEAGHIIDYHDQDWPGQVRAITGRHGAAAAANAAPGGAASAIRAVADGGRLATITSDPPSQQRGITVSSIYVRADGNQLRNLAQQFGDRQLQIPVAASYRLTDAAQALAQATGGHAAGAIALTP
jgi:NADPH:quinone reductase-like Zn-dependent oxidoreductase